MSGQPKWAIALLAAKTAAFEEWTASLTERHVAIPSDDLDGLGKMATWSVGMPPHPNDTYLRLFVLSEEVADWIFETTTGHRIIQHDWLYRRQISQFVAIEFKSVKEAVAFRLRFLDRMIRNRDQAEP
ncbi:hypothetical protein [uncultured Brevundimonas sp.]|uniref:hypothetical protein n=1 Tax=uncultured Brevundimonas sp. TaxID=213418 RepID=UPI0025E0EF7D|nr:hypothetical protein [uncultured Brevundimonas sp.]